MSGGLVDPTWEYQRQAVNSTMVQQGLIKRDHVWLAQVAVITMRTHQVGAHILQVLIPTVWHQVPVLRLHLSSI